jgi:dTDP-4-amino-4,6-dideoxygalactose transaminase
MINFANPKSEYLDKKNEIDLVISQTLKSNDYILGKSVKKFERNFSNYNQCKYSIGVSSGTEAIIICLKSLGIKMGDEVITTSHTAYATVAAITEIGAKPVLIDIENNYFNMNYEEIAKNLTKKTKCLILVHLYGIVANVKKIKEICTKNRIFLIEDCAQAHGAEFNGKKVGTFGDFGTFSFYPTKNLSTFGDAGAIITNNHKLYTKAKLYREYGWGKKNIGILKSINRRMDEIHAAILNVKLKYLNNYNKKRVKIAQLYSNEIKNKNIILPQTLSGTKNVFHLYVIIVKKNLRNKLIKFLQKNNINPGIHYKLANHQQIPFKNFKKSKLINTKKIVPNILSLPIYPALSLVNVKKIIKLINLFD